MYLNWNFITKSVLSLKPHYLWATCNLVHSFWASNTNNPHNHRAYVALDFNCWDSMSHAMFPGTRDDKDRTSLYPLPPALCLLPMAGQPLNLFWLSLTPLQNPSHSALLAASTNREAEWESILIPSWKLVLRILTGITPKKNSSSNTFLKWWIKIIYIALLKGVLMPLMIMCLSPSKWRRYYAHSPNFLGYRNCQSLLSLPARVQSRGKQCML